MSDETKSNALCNRDKVTVLDKIDNLDKIYKKKNVSLKGMDDLNKKALNVLMTQGTKKFIEHVHTDPKDPKKKLSYGEMRSYYG